MATDETRKGRGRGARSPREVTGRGWKAVLLRVKDRIKADNLPIIAAGLAYYALFSLVPLLVAMVSIYGLVTDPAQVQAQAAAFTGILPASAQEIVQSQLSSIASTSSSALGWSLAASILVALWGASSGVKQLIQATNIAYDEEESRGFFKVRGLALLMTLAVVVFAVVALVLLAVVPGIIDSLGLGGVGEFLVTWGRWPVLALGLALGLAALYRYAPDRRAPKWRWVTWGAGIAVAVWLVASVGLNLYVSNTDKFGATYGALAGLVVLLMWFFLSAFAVLLGAEIDAELEHQTARDTTVGEERPRGERGARKADTVGPGPGEHSRAEDKPGRGRPPVYREPGANREGERHNGGPPEDRPELRR